MKILQKGTALFCLFLSLSAASVVASVDAPDFDDARQESNYHRLTQQLRCPQCQNNNIADSNATIALDMRAKVLDLLKQGKSEQEVVDYMVERYGNFVTYDPPMTASTLILWLAPLLVALVGLGLALKRKAAAGGRQSAVGNKEISSEELTAEEQARLNEILNKEQK